MAFDRLIKRIQETGNPSVAGLDPKLTMYRHSSVKSTLLRMA